MKDRVVGVRQRLFYRRRWLVAVVSAACVFLLVMPFVWHQEHLLLFAAYPLVTIVVHSRPVTVVTASGISRPWRARRRVDWSDVESVEAPAGMSKVTSETPSAGRVRLHLTNGRQVTLDDISASEAPMIAGLGDKPMRPAASVKISLPAAARTDRVRALRRRAPPGRATGPGASSPREPTSQRQLDLAPVEPGPRVLSDARHSTVSAALWLRPTSRSLMGRFVTNPVRGAGATPALCVSMRACAFRCPTASALTCLSSGTDPRCCGLPGGPGLNCIEAGPGP